MTLSIYVAVVVTLSPLPDADPAVGVVGLFSTRERCELQIARLPVAAHKRYFCRAVGPAPPKDPVLAPLKGDFMPNPGKG